MKQDQKIATLCIAFLLATTAFAGIIPTTRTTAPALPATPAEGRTGWTVTPVMTYSQIYSIFNATASGDTVTFSAGTYDFAGIVSDPLFSVTSLSSLTVVGSGAVSVESSGKNFVSNYVGPLTISHMNFINTSLVAYDNIHVSNCTINNTGAIDGLWTGSRVGVYLDNCSIITGGKATSSTGSYDIFARNTYVETGDVSFWTSGGGPSHTDGPTMRGTFTNVTAVSAVGVIYSWFLNLTISSCDFTSGGTCIAAHNDFNGNISDTTIEADTTCVDVVNFTGPLVRDNFLDFGTHGILCSGYFTGNIVSSTISTPSDGTDGLNLGGSFRSNISDSTIFCGAICVNGVAMIGNITDSSFNGTTGTLSLTSLTGNITDCSFNNSITILSFVGDISGITETIWDTYFIQVPTFTGNIKDCHIFAENGVIVSGIFTGDIIDCNFSASGFGTVSIDSAMYGNIENSYINGPSAIQIFYQEGNISNTEVVGDYFGSNGVTGNFVNDRFLGDVEMDIFTGAMIGCTFDNNNGFNGVMVGDIIDCNFDCTVYALFLPEIYGNVTGCTIVARFCDFGSDANTAFYCNVTDCSISAQIEIANMIGNFTRCVINGTVRCTEILESTPIVAIQNISFNGCTFYVYNSTVMFDTTYATHLQMNGSTIIFDGNQTGTFIQTKRSMDIWCANSTVSGSGTQVSYDKATGATIPINVYGDLNANFGVADYTNGTIDYYREACIKVVGQENVTINIKTGSTLTEAIVTDQHGVSFSAWHLYGEYFHGANTHSAYNFNFTAPTGWTLANTVCYNNKTKAAYPFTLVGGVIRWSGPLDDYCFFSTLMSIQLVQGFNAFAYPGPEGVHISAFLAAHPESAVSEINFATGINVTDGYSENYWPKAADHGTDFVMHVGQTYVVLCRFSRGWLNFTSSGLNTIIYVGYEDYNSSLGNVDQNELVVANNNITVTNMNSTRTIHTLSFEPATGYWINDETGWKLRMTTYTLDLYQYGSLVASQNTTNGTVFFDNLELWYTQSYDIKINYQMPDFAPAGNYTLAFNITTTNGTAQTLGGNNVGLTVNADRTITASPNSLTYPSGATGSTYLQYCDNYLVIANNGNTKYDRIDFTSFSTLSDGAGHNVSPVDKLHLEDAMTTAKFDDLTTGHTTLRIQYTSLTGWMLPNSGYWPNLPANTWPENQKSYRLRLSFVIPAGQAPGTYTGTFSVTLYDGVTPSNTATITQKIIVGSAVSGSIGYGDDIGMIEALQGGDPNFDSLTFGAVGPVHSDGTTATSIYVALKNTGLGNWGSIDFSFTAMTSTVDPSYRIPFGGFGVMYDNHGHESGVAMTGAGPYLCGFSYSGGVTPGTIVCFYITVILPNPLIAGAYAGTFTATITAPGRAPDSITLAGRTGSYSLSTETLSMYTSTGSDAVHFAAPIVVGRNSTESLYVKNIYNNSIFISSLTISNNDVGYPFQLTVFSNALGYPDGYTMTTNTLPAGHSGYLLVPDDVIDLYFQVNYVGISYSVASSYYGNVTVNSLYFPTGSDQQVRATSPGFNITMQAAGISFEYGRGTTFFCLPSIDVLTTAQDLLNQGAFAVGRYVSSTQKYEYKYTGLGSDFALVPGEGYLLIFAGSTTITTGAIPSYSTYTITGHVSLHGNPTDTPIRLSQIVNQSSDIAWAAAINPENNRWVYYFQGGFGTDMLLNSLDAALVGFSGTSFDVEIGS